MILAEIQDNRIRVDAPITYKDLVKRVPGARYTDGQWTVPLSWAACKQLRAELGELLEVGAQLVDWSLEYVKRRDTVMWSRTQESFDTWNFDSRLAIPQKQGALWMAYAGGGLLADEMRTGKTPMTIEALELLGERALPALVVAPSTMRFVWKDEFANWASSLNVQVLHGTATQRRKQLTSDFDILVSSWDLLRFHSRLAPYGSIELSDKEKERKELNEAAFQTVIFDEAHRMADPKSKQTRAAWFLAHEATYRYALTGTPVVNRPSDLFSIMHGLAPNEYPVRSSWIDRYCLNGQGRFGWEIFGLRPERQEELHEILQPRMLRRTLAEVRPYMPEVLPAEVRHVELEGTQLKNYNALKKEMIVGLEDGILVESDPFVLFGRLTQMAAGTPVLDEVGNVVALKEPSIKVQVLLETLEEKPGAPLVVFSHSRKLIELCAKKLSSKKISYVEITGAVDPQMRAANVARFQLGDVQVALCTTGAGAEGITLNRASRSLFLQVPPSLVQWKQAAARTGGKEHGDPLETIVSIVQGTVEERMVDIVNEKEVYLQEVLQDALRTRN